MPFAPALVTADVEAVIGGVRVTLSQPLQYRLIDQVRGELRRNLDVMPAITVNLDSQLEVVPTASLGHAAARRRPPAEQRADGAVRHARV